MSNNTKEDILNATYILIAEQGIQKASFAQIAKAVGISKPSIYYYFESKDDLIKQLFDFFCTEIQFNNYFRIEDFTAENFVDKLVKIGVQMIQDQKQDPYYDNVMKEFLSLAARDKYYQDHLLEIQSFYLKGFEKLLKKASSLSLITDEAVEEKAHILALVLDNIGNLIMENETINYKGIWITAVKLVFLKDDLNG
ncbi:TetR/AcrR family transcriptional regulator [Lysinibacillus sp. NPDC096418]|uniref:TetR/AcrR family transcriptional regulator n=1 Tax=Lysinibacillus sp. NPDC096418 TaxID=3364138 RepID=UPI00382B1963